ncbi:serine hydrolase domain-containing protein [Maribacter chungangensis]|uniref:Serine hydrolase domain-containing protein n=1 Tax=Maribacter chungangensis TaxID=1069117 RepID=A0ABW3B6K0_9FLAO
MRKINRLLFVYLVAICNVKAQEYKAVIQKARFLVEAHKTQTKLPGCQIAVMVKGKLVWSEGFGFSDLQNRTKVSTKTKFRIASVSKPVTAMALGKLIDQGKLDIHKDINTYLPSFPKKKFTITTKHLAFSTSGIRHYNSKDKEFNTKEYPTVLDALKRFEEDPLSFEPGTQFLYSSYGWVLLSAVMEKASRTSFFNLMQNTWDALGMKQTSFDFPHKEIDQKSRFYVHHKKLGRKLTPFENRSYMYAGGGYLSTAEDLVRMGDQLINSNFLNEETKQVLTQPYLLKDGTSTFYGMGWETGTNRLGTKVFFHSGSLPTSVAHLVIYPEEEVVLAYLSNTGDHVFFNDREAQTITELFAEEEGVAMNQAKDVVGSWNITTTSLNDKKTGGTLLLTLNTDGMLHGSISFKRSKKTITCPLIVTTLDTNELHAVAVSPMFIDFYLKFNNDEFMGKWLHDFNVKGITEKDAYWKAREITGKKILTDEND